MTPIWRTEGNLQAIAAELGIAPAVAAIEQFPGGVGNRIEMADIRGNFEKHGDSFSWLPRRY